MVILLSACKKSHGSLNILTVSGSCYYLTMFSKASKAAVVSGKGWGLGEGFISFCI